MSNYTSENLINVKPSQVPAGTLAVKIGEDVFTAGSVTVGEEVTAGYFAKDGDDLKFYPAGSQTGEVVSEIMVVDTGKEEPQYEGGSGSSMNFYKCASVDTSNSTWSGHLASVSDSTGIWYFSSDSTSLVYDRLIPVVGSVYDEGCSFQVTKYKTGLPEDGLIFYLALADEIGDTDDTGTYALTKVNTNYSFDNKNGILCMKMGTGAKIYGPNFNSVLPNTSSTRYTVSFWACGTPDSNTTYQGPTGGFLYNTNNTDGTALRVCYSSILASYDGRKNEVSVENANMAFFYMIYDGTQIEWYKNGQRVYNKTSAVPFGSSFTNTYPCICMETSGAGGYGDGYMTAFRIYNRVLTSSEIDALANEFHPTAS